MSYLPSRYNFLLGVNSLLLTLVMLTLSAAAQDEISQSGRDAAKWITVRVEDSDGRPIQNFEYAYKGGAVAEVPRGADGSLPRFNPVSDAQGIARVRFFPNYYKGAWRVTLIVSAPDYVTNFHVIEPDKLAETRVILDRAAKMSGRILDTAGNPIAGAQVWLDHIPDGRHGRPAHIMESDSLGRIASDRIPIGRISFAILHPDFLAGAYERQVTEGNLNEFSFVLEGGASLSGSLFFASESPEQAYVFVNASNPDYAIRDPRDKRATCENGKFVIKGILPGTSHVVFRVFQHQTGFRDADWVLTEEFHLSQREEKQIEKSIPTGSSTLAGRILLHGVPMKSEYSVSISLAHEEMGVGRSLQVDSHPNDIGEYAFRNLPSGFWHMSVHSWDDEVQQSYHFQKRIKLTAGEALRLDIDFPESATQ